MQGKKKFTPKLFHQIQLQDLVPEDNFYRRLDSILDLQFLYKKTKKYYGSEGQKSIDPQVFIKICLVGYLNNIISDRQLINHCKDSLSIRLFLRYDIDEQLPWHSTISRTRQLYDQELFLEIFQRVLDQCIDSGLVSGHTQALDSAFVKANASMDSLEIKVPQENLEEHLRKVRHISDEDKNQPARKAKNNKAQNDQKQISASKEELDHLKRIQSNWAKGQNRKGSNHNLSKYTSNKTHYSPVDPDARISVKPGKARKLNYLSQMSVDVDHHVITHIEAVHADKKDNQYLEKITEQLEQNLKRRGIVMENLLADAGYSSGVNYAYLERKRIKSFIPPHGTYKGGPENFEYLKDEDAWLCRNGVKATYRKTKMHKNGTLQKLYYTKRSQCKNCPFKLDCIKKSHEKRIAITAFKDEYDRNIERLKRNKSTKAKRMSTVEPVFGTLINFLGMKKVNTLGIAQANKCMLLAATAYNLKKILKYKSNKRRSVFNALLEVRKNVKNGLNDLINATFEIGMRYKALE